MNADEKIAALLEELEKMIERYHDLRKLAYQTASDHLLRLVDESFLCAPEDGQKLIDRIKNSEKEV